MRNVPGAVSKNALGNYMVKKDTDTLVHWEI